MTSSDAALRRLLADPAASASDLLSAARALRDGFVRNEHSVGMLPVDSPELLEAGYRAAGERGSGEAWTELAQLFRTGAAPWAPYPRLDHRAAIDAYRRAEALGSPSATLGWIRTAYFARDADWAPSVVARLAELYAADPDDPAVLLLLGYALHQGYGYERDTVAAVGFFRAAATRGDAAAAFELSVIHTTGDGAPVDPEQVLEWTRRAADLGSARAQGNLGARYATGDGVELDPVAAVHWYERAAEGGNARAAFIAGVMLTRGDDGMSPDPARAEELFARAEMLGAEVDEMLEGIGLPPRS